MRVRPVDWQMVMLDLRRAGHTLHALAARTSSSKSRLGRLATVVGEPPHSIGDRLLLLWQEATGLPRHRAPQISRD
jgi:hypothetical protein